MRIIFPILIAILFCASCVMFLLGDDDTARVFGTSDSWSIERVIAYPMLFLQPWVLIASLFRDHVFSALVVIQCAAAIFYSVFLIWLRRWKTAYRITAVFITSLSFLLLFYGWRMHAAAVRAEREYRETFGR